MAASSPRRLPKPIVLLLPRFYNAPTMTPYQACMGTRKQRAPATLRSDTRDLIDAPVAVLSDECSDFFDPRGKVQPHTDHDGIRIRIRLDRIEIERGNGILCPQEERDRGASLNLGL